MCVEHGVRLSRTSHLFLSHASLHCVGGLPGMVLTMGDAGRTAIRVVGPPGVGTFLHATRHFLKG